MKLFWALWNYSNKGKGNEKRHKLTSSVTSLTNSAGFQLTAITISKPLAAEPHWRKVLEKMTALAQTDSCLERTFCVVAWWALEYFFFSPPVVSIALAFSWSYSVQRLMYRSYFTIQRTCGSPHRDCLWVFGMGSIHFYSKWHQCALQSMSSSVYFCSVVVCIVVWPFGWPF